MSDEYLSPDKIKNDDLLKHLRDYNLDHSSNDIHVTFSNNNTPELYGEKAVKDDNQYLKFQMFSADRNNHVATSPIPQNSNSQNSNSQNNNYPKG